MKTRFNVFRDGHLHVCKRMCDTCIYRPDTKVPAPATKMDAAELGLAVTCHSTYKWFNRTRADARRETNAVCYGSFVRNQAMPEIILAQALDVVRFVDPPKLGTV